MNPQSPQNNPVQPHYSTPDPTQPTPPAPGNQEDPHAYKQQFERPKEKGMHSMVVLQPGELVVATIKRHPFGIVSLYAAALLGMAVTGIIAYLLVPDLTSQFNSDGAGLAVGVAASIIVLLILVLGVATSVYWQNEWIVTTDSITQVTQNSLFGRQVSQLSMDNLEDVTVNQDGILPHMFGFGELKVESAGERSKFVFPYCPNPNKYARTILEIHEHFLEERRNVQYGYRGPASFSTNSRQPDQQ
ncbi:MAG TPA: PH domain-containing protein [Candidatus Saccharimonadales bacterium]|nr:PH domain-containing protein [Candidatus Saccharimonadales bacterium]